MSCCVQCSAVQPEHRVSISFTVVMCDSDVSVHALCSNKKAPASTAFAGGCCWLVNMQPRPGLPFVLDSGFEFTRPMIYQEEVMAVLRNKDLIAGSPPS